MVDASGLYYPDGQIHEEDYEYASFLSSQMHEAGVICVNCHNPHTAKVRLPGNWLCLQCHGGGDPKAPKIDPVAHSHHQVRGYDANGKLVETDLTKFESANFSETGGECVSCHMPQTVYMQRHWRHDHGFTIPDPLLTKELGIPNACNRCHQDKNADWALDATRKWYGAEMDTRLAVRRERTRGIALARSGDAAAVGPLLNALAGNEAGYWRAAIVNQLAPWSARADVQAALRGTLADTNALVRGKAAYALGTTAEDLEPATVAALDSRLDDPVRVVRVAAAWSLRGSLDIHSAAGQDLQTFLNENADEPAGQMQLGEFYAGRGEMTNALTHFQKAVAWDRGSAPFHRELAVTWSLLNQNSNAVDELRAAVRLDPRNAPFHFELALALNAVGDLDGTVAELETATQLDPGQARVWYNLALARERKANGAGAREAVEHALQLQPDFPEARNFLRSLPPQAGRVGD
jgi:predicted CXXCH cytochrome family protein